MANFAVTGQYVPAGVNQGNMFTVKVVCPILANTDTLTVTLPEGAPKDAVPMGNAIGYSLSGEVYTPDADISVAPTSHNRQTGVTVFTAVGAVAAGTIALVAYAGIG